MNNGKEYTPLRGARQTPRREEGKKVDRMDEMDEMDEMDRMDRMDRICGMENDFTGDT